MSALENKNLQEILNKDENIKPVLEYMLSKKGISFDKMRENKRYEELVMLRGEIAYVLYYLFKHKLTLKDISVIINKKSHASIINIINRIKDYTDVNKSYRKYMEYLIIEIQNIFKVDLKNNNKLFKELNEKIIINKLLNDKIKKVTDYQDRLRKILEIEEKLNKELNTLYAQIISEYGE